MKWKLQGAGQGWAPTLTSRGQQPSQQPCTTTPQQGSGPRTWQMRRTRNRGKLARGATCGAKAPGWVWAHGPLGVIGSPPLFQAAWEASSQPHGLATVVAGSGVLGSPTLAVWRSARFLGPLPGCLNLFWQAERATSPATEPRPATRHQVDTKAPTPARVGTNGRTEGVLPNWPGAQTGGHKGGSASEQSNGNVCRKVASDCNARGLGHLWAAFTPRAESAHNWDSIGRWGDATPHQCRPPAGASSQALVTAAVVAGLGRGVPPGAPASRTRPEPYAVPGSVHALRAAH